MRRSTCRESGALLGGLLERVFLTRGDRTGARSRNALFQRLGCRRIGSLGSLVLPGSAPELHLSGLKSVELFVLDRTGVRLGSALGDELALDPDLGPLLQMLSGDLSQLPPARDWDEVRSALVARPTEIGVAADSDPEPGPESVCFICLLVALHNGHCGEATDDGDVV